jgi:hypothetical protein
MSRPSLSLDRHSPIGAAERPRRGPRQPRCPHPRTTRRARWKVSPPRAPRREPAGQHFRHRTRLRGRSPPRVRRPRDLGLRPRLRPTPRVVLPSPGG